MRSLLPTLISHSTVIRPVRIIAEAVEDMKKVVELEPTASHKKELTRVEKVQAEHFEKQKEEMLGTLKTFGNKILGNFGLSTDNFKMTPQEGGGYSVNFEQNPTS